MITQEAANHFALEWVAAWNSHDLNRILSHYTDDFSIETPVAASLLPETKGVVEGKEAVRKYWTLGLQKQVNLKFELIKVLVGIKGITIYYHSVVPNKKVSEVFWLNDEGKAYQTFVYYGEAEA